MKVEFYGGPYDGLEEECEVGYEGQEWRVLCGPVSGFAFPLEEAHNVPPLQLPVARYRLKVDGLYFVGML